jgi:glycosyltransferase involved in cell wall biosynthesis
MVKEGRPIPFMTRLEAAGVPTTPIRMSRFGYVRERRRLAEVLASEQSEVLHAHGYRANVAYTSVARAAGIAAVATAHGFTGGDWKNRLYEDLERRAFRTLDAVVAVSARLGRELVGSGVARDKVHVVRNAWAPARRARDRMEARERLGIGPNEKVIGWVGRLGREKGPDVMLAALRALDDPCVKLSVLGDGAMRAELESLARHRGVADRVRWHGPVEEAGRELRAFDVLAISSRTEGTPMVLLEAMSAGVPIVTTAVGGIPDVVGPDEAFIVPSPDPLLFAQALDGALRDPAGARDRASAASARLERDFAVEAWVHAYQGVYEAAVRGRG